jgi:hypothetical protein
MAAVVGPGGALFRRPVWGGLETAWPLEAGKVTLRGLPVGPCTITVTAADQRTWTGTAEVTAGGTVDLTLR